MRRADLSWLTARPFAHRGLHDGTTGVIENTPSAFRAAIADDYGIECDVQLTMDGEAMVHHDFDLRRLTDGTGPLSHLTAAELKEVRFKATADRMLTLPELLELVDGRVGILVEIKSRFDGDLRLTQRTAAVLGNYKGPVAAMSFDPACVAELKRLAPDTLRGIVAERHYAHGEWAHLSVEQKRDLGELRHAERTRPDFVNYRVQDLPVPLRPLADHLGRVAVLAWTVRTEADRLRARQWADQIVFEGFRA